jgi:hypothetical protein
MGEYKEMTAEGEGIMCQRERVFPEHWASISQCWPIIAKGEATPSTGAEMTVSVGL